MTQSEGHYLCCQVGQEWYGVDVDNVMEVLPMIALTEMPEAPLGVIGLLTLRDVVMPVIDLRRRFGHNDAPLRLDTPIIACQTPDGPLALIVNDADQIVSVTKTQDIPHTTPDAHCIAGAAKLPDRLLLLLDLAQLAVTLDDIPPLADDSNTDDTD
ncbi:MAG: chemotaxis protein CheW [Anaerolineae bacterium]|nr:chemotaxis protein CheW [Anaerolineae bacterium]